MVPFVCAAAVAGKWEWALLWAAFGLTALFLLRGSIEAQDGWKALRGPAHLFLAIAAGIPAGLLIFVYRRSQLVPIAVLAAALYLLQRRWVQLHTRKGTEKRSLAAELIGVALLTLAAPLGWITARGSLNATGAQVWLLNLLFHLGGVLYVKYRVRGIRTHQRFGPWRERLAFAWPVVLYHFLVLAFVTCWVFLESLSAAVLVAFAPGLLRANGLLFQLGRRFPIRRLGWSEVAHSVVFATLLILAFRL